MAPVRPHPSGTGERVSPYLLSVTLHVLAALLWLGGMFFLAAVGAPVGIVLVAAAVRLARGG